MLDWAPVLGSMVTVPEPLAGVATRPKTRSEIFEMAIERMTVAWNRPVVPEVGDAGLSAA